MELDATLAAFERARSRWAKLNFFEAKSHLSAEESWDLFGPPASRLRWCCSVHKSVPTILKLREITGNYDVRAVVFDGGVRREESVSRAGYDIIGKGVKTSIKLTLVLSWIGGARPKSICICFTINCY